MKSSWSEYKNEAVYLREHGLSITYIEDKLGIPRSTLSEWFKNVTLTAEQQANLKKRKLASLKAHQDAAQAKAARLRQAREAAELKQAVAAAESVMSNVGMTTPALRELSVALIYRDGDKDKSVIAASADPAKLKWILPVLGVDFTYIECTLQLSPGVDDMQARTYWSDALGLPIEQFTEIKIDNRSHGVLTDMGTCTLRCTNKAIQRKLRTLYNLFCERAMADKGD